MKPARSVTPESPIADQIRFLDDFLRDGGAVAPTPPEPADPRRQVLLRVRAALAQVQAQVAAEADF